MTGSQLGWRGHARFGLRALGAPRRLKGNWAAPPPPLAPSAASPIRRVPNPPRPPSAASPPPHPSARPRGWRGRRGHVHTGTGSRKTSRPPTFSRAEARCINKLTRCARQQRQLRPGKHKNEDGINSLRSARAPLTSYHRLYTLYYVRSARAPVTSYHILYTLYYVRSAAAPVTTGQKAMFFDSGYRSRSHGNSIKYKA